MMAEEKSFMLLFGGLTVYRYGLLIALGCLLAGGYIFYRSRSNQKSQNAAALTCLLSPLMGLMLARLVYVLAEINFSPFLTLPNILNLRLGGFSMYGALLGAVLGAVLSAKASKIKISEWLDVVAPAFFLFIACARFGEQYTALGVSRPLVSGVLDHSFLAMQGEYNAYLRTYLLETAAALILFFASILYSKKKRKTGDVFLFAALQFGIWQTLFESLRFDSHLRFSFIGLQQLLSALLFGGVLIYLAARLLRGGRKKALAIISLSVLPFVTAALIGLEFMIDRSQISKWWSYAVYVTVLLIPCVLGQLMLKEERV